MDERGIFRVGLQVPKDQRALLDKRDAWAEVMRRTPQGLLNIPPSVIEDLKAFHAPKTQSAPAAPSTPITWAEPMRKTPQGLLNVPSKVLEDLKTFHAQKVHATPAAASKPVTWAEPISKTPRGLLNVPPKILESLTAFHAQKSAFATAATSSSQASLFSQEPKPTEPMPPSSSPPREPYQRRTAVTAQADDACSPSDTPISGWSPSPPRNDHPRGAAAIASPPGPLQALPPRTATNSSMQMNPNDSGPGPSSERTAKSIVQSTTASMSTPEENESPPRQVITPSSNEADSEEEQMAVEEPLALAPAFQKSINKTAAPVAPTPPSAQVVPCTDQKNPHQQRPKIKRRKMKNALGLLDKCLGKIPDCDTSGQQAVPSRSTSIAKRRSETTTPVSRQSPRDQGSPKALSSSQSPQSDHEPAPHASQHAKITTKLPRASDSLGTGSVTANPVTSQAEPTPFEIFRTNYPDFTSDLANFLRACMSLQWLARQSLLKVSLFDDFLRVYCHKYIPFVMSHDSAPSAIEYYNKDDEAISYLNGVVDKSFLKRVQALYSAEIAAIEAGNSVGDPTETSQVRVEDEDASADMEIDQPDEGSIADNPEEHAGSHNAATRSSPDQPTQPEEVGISDIEDDRFYRSSREASPDLSTPASHSRQNPMSQGDTHTQPKFSAPFTGSIMDLTSSAASDVVIPNTSISVLDANPSRIPETVHKPRSRQRIESAKRPFRLIASLRNRDSPTSSMSSAQRKRRFSEYLAKNGQRNEA
ncbi:hypothetical protein MCOR27_008529 [Pyricularia oryzae]|uniref:Uncharacterized protein n=1 Tax=Pyricularia grisea TaxID=148305 RepID=A0ABQ8NDT2_PYRGI|nr:hypothetical protein MCOR01_010824 [Pyricularia oryzae]KAI6295414.1 hypothetical protein MCOR33_007690 [Pyricularia grisea]KAI6255428.1 hypothetical protein MCOR19_008082 [Pyricularia oryzae]KAI6272065.1 hypothetical protein MCOR27_008529 [Pyricularia oryzae]KAI6278833.1 hypothetical protein MCOR26_004485 [Pyricularia oryzae]